MSITLISQPEILSPVKNPIYFVFDSTNKNEQGFRYIADIYSAGTNQRITRQLIPPRINDGYGIFNINSILNSECTFFINQNLTGFSKCPENFINYEVQVGEQFVQYWDFSDNFFYSNSASTYNANVGFTSATDTHNFVVGDLIYITQNPTGATNSGYDGVQEVVVVIDNYSFVVGYSFGVSTTAEAGTAVFADQSRTLFTGLTAYTGYTAFRGAASHFDIPDWSTNNHKISTANTGSFLTNVPNNYRIRRSNSMYLNFYSDDTYNNARYLIIETDNGGKYSIENTKTGSNTMLTVACGCGDLSASTYSAITGSSPIIQDSTTKYSAYTTDINLNRTSEIKEFEIDDSCTAFDEFELLFQDRLGSFVPANFNLNHTRTISKSTGQYKKIIGDINKGSWSFDSTEAGINILNSNENEEYTVNSIFLRPAERNYIKELYTSRNVFVRLNGSLHPIIVTTDSLPIPTLRNQRNASYQLSFVFANKNMIP